MQHNFNTIAFSLIIELKTYNFVRQEFPAIRATIIHNDLLLESLLHVRFYVLTYIRSQVLRSLRSFIRTTGPSRFCGAIESIKSPVHWRTLVQSFAETESEPSTIKTTSTGSSHFSITVSGAERTRLGPVSSPPQKPQLRRQSITSLKNYNHFIQDCGLK